MKRTLAIAALLCAIALNLHAEGGATAGAREEFRRSGLGIFIHWGVSSMLGSGEWVMTNRNLDYEEYRRLAGAFCPSGFDAREWARDIKASGAEYVCITTRHHDGFSLFKSELTDFNMVDATPFGRDVIAELAEACREEGLRLHMYYSLIDWGRPDAPRGGTGRGTGRPQWDGDYGPYLTFMKGQLTELLTNYGPVGAVWFDGDWDMPEGFDWKYDELYGLIHALQPSCLIGNNHHLAPKEGEDIQIFERDLPGENTAGYSGRATIGSLPLETCQTMSSSWGYAVNDTIYKPVGELIRYLVGAAGRGANLLLNIGPRPDGTMPEEAVLRLRQIGEWMEQYGHTIKGTCAGDVPPRDWGVTTRKGDTLFVHITGLKDSSLYLPLSCKVRKAVCLNDGKEIGFRQDRDGVLLKLGRVPDESDHIIMLTTSDK